jgi:PHS family inorganic phosphate transporter-like MFS transporter
MIHIIQDFYVIGAEKVMQNSYGSIMNERQSKTTHFGFASNPFASSSQRIAMLANFSTSFNMVNIGYALHFLSHDITFLESKPGGRNFGESLCSSIFIIGIIFGQLAGGSLGDVLSRHHALLIIMSFQVIASFGSMLVPLHSIDTYWRLTFFDVLAFWRLLLGIGCGGVYPLAATMAMESSKNEEERAKVVALTFSTQGIGFISAPLLAQALLFVFGEKSVHWIWRVVLGAGFIPGVLIFLLMTASSELNKEEPTSNPNISQQQTVDCDSFIALEEGLKLYSTESLPLFTKTTQATYAQVRGEKASIIESILQEDKIIEKMCSTAFCWFLLDVIFYGNTFFTPVVLERAFGLRETLFDSMRDSTILTLIALPGYYVSVFTIGYQTPMWVQRQGFMLMFLLYGIIGLNFNYLAGADNKSSLLLLYGLTFFFSNYGPNTTTFMLPSLTFSPGCRSTLNGICAACGKIGALAGVTLFEPTAAKFGDSAVMLLCSGLSLLGFLLTCYGMDTAGDMRRIFSLSSLTSASVEDYEQGLMCLSHQTLSCSSCTDKENG